MESLFFSKCCVANYKLYVLNLDSGVLEQANMYNVICDDYMNVPAEDKTASGK